MNRLYNCVFVFSILTCLGCGPAAREAPSDLLPVSGTLTIDGEPASHVTIVFTPDNATAGQGGYTVTDDSGHFEVKHMSNVEGANGVEPGSYVLSFSKLTMPDGNPIPEGKDAADVGATESLPKKLSSPDPERPAHILKVDEAKTDVKLDLKTK